MLEDGTLERLTPEQKGLVKTMEISVLVKRSIFGSDYLPKTAYFKQDLVLHIPSERAYKYVYFYKEPAMDNIAVRNFSPALKNLVGLTYLLDLDNAEFVKKKNKAKKITIEMARKLLQSKEALALFTDEALNQEAI